MAKLITGEALRKAVVDQTFIKGGDPEGVEGVKYDFRLGSKVLKAKFGRPIDLAQLGPEYEHDFVIDPGEMVFVMTVETLELPKDVIAHLSPKRKVSHHGVLPVGGFCIDAGYRGPLLIGLYNFSSNTFPLLLNRKVIAATFMRLEPDECGDFPTPEPLKSFPDDLIHMMEKYRPALALALEQEVSKLRNQVEDIRREVHDRDEWYQRLKVSLDAHDAQIGKLIGGLEDEVQARAKGEDKFGATLESIQRTLTWLRGALFVVGALVTLIGGPLLVMWIWDLIAKKAG